MTYHNISIHIDIYIRIISVYGYLEKRIDIPTFIAKGKMNNVQQHIYT